VELRRAMGIGNKAESMQVNRQVSSECRTEHTDVCSRYGRRSQGSRGELHVRRSCGFLSDWMMPSQSPHSRNDQVVSAGTGVACVLLGPGR